MSQKQTVPGPSDAERAMRRWVVVAAAIEAAVIVFVVYHVLSARVQEIPR